MNLGLQQSVPTPDISTAPVPLEPAAPAAVGRAEVNARAQDLMATYGAGSLLVQDSYRGSLYFAMNAMITSYNNTSDPLARGNIARDGDELLDLAKRAGMVPQDASFERYYEKLTGQRLASDLSSPSRDTPGELTDRSVLLEAQRVAPRMEVIQAALTEEARTALQREGLVSDPAQVQQRLREALAAEPIDFLKSRKDGEPPILAWFYAMGLIKSIDDIPEILRAQRRMNDQVASGDLKPPPGSDRYKVGDIIRMGGVDPAKVDAAELFLRNLPPRQ